MDFATMLELAKAGLLKAEPVDEHFIEQEPPRSDGKEWFGSDPVSKFREQRKYFSGPPLSPEAHAALVAKLVPGAPVEHSGDIRKVTDLRKVYNSGGDGVSGTAAFQKVPASSQLRKSADSELEQKVRDLIRRKYGVNLA